MSDPTIIDQDVQSMGDAMNGADDNADPGMARVPRAAGDTFMNVNPDDGESQGSGERGFRRVSLPTRVPAHDAMSEARNAGYSWADINAHMAGIPTTQPHALADRLRPMMQQNFAAGDDA